MFEKWENPCPSWVWLKDVSILEITATSVPGSCMWNGPQSTAALKGRQEDADWKRKR